MTNFLNVLSIFGSLVLAVMTFRLARHLFVDRSGNSGRFGRHWSEGD